MHIAFDSRHDDFRAFGLHAIGGVLNEGNELRHRLFHHPRAFDDLRQEHLARAEQFTYPIHAVHERAFNNLNGPFVFQPRLLCICFNELQDALHERVPESFFNGKVPPFSLLRCAIRNCTDSGERLGEGDKPVGGI